MPEVADFLAPYSIENKRQSRLRGLWSFSQAGRLGAFAVTTFRIATSGFDKTDSASAANSPDESSDLLGTRVRPFDLTYLRVVNRRDCAEPAPEADAYDDP
jgi:hypothetical protein